VSSHYVPAELRRKIGHITPSSNTVLEPLTALISRSLDDRISHHFTRVKVKAITLQERHTDQFRPEAMLAAADLLADAAVDAIIWNGTSGGWNGLDADREMCSLISEHTGTPASTSTLAQLDVLAATGLRRCGLAVPYTDDVTARIIEVYEGAGIQIVASANHGVSGNREMALVPEAVIADLLRRADSPDADCLMLICTGVAGAQLVEAMERELRKPIFDSVAVGLWKGLALAGIEPRIDGWGSLLAGTAHALTASS
jgi:maleate isomerase